MTQEEILLYGNKAQTKICEYAEIVEEQLRKGLDSQYELSMGIELLDFQISLFDPRNQWTNDEKFKWINFMTERHNLIEVAYVDFDPFFLPIVISDDLPPGTYVTHPELNTAVSIINIRIDGIEDRVIALENIDYSDLIPQQLLDDVAEALSTSQQNSLDINDLQIVTNQILSDLSDHINDDDVHIQPGERSDWNNRVTQQELQDGLDEKANLVHTHPMSDVDGLTDAITALNSAIADLPAPQDGEDGITPTITIGTVISGPIVSVEVDPSSTTSNVILNFVLEKGDDGEDGDDGAPGAPGTDHFKGKFLTLIALEAALPTADDGDYAHVDPGSGDDLIVYWWDDEEGWIQQAGGGGGSGTVESVTGDGVNNTDPDNPVLTFPVASEVDFTATGDIIATNVQAAIVELDNEKISTDYIDTDDTLSADSDDKIATQRAVKAYIDALIDDEVIDRDSAIAIAVAGLMDYRGDFDASVNMYPSTGGSGPGGAIMKADFWFASMAGVLPTSVNVTPGDLIIAKIDSPGNTQSNWSVIEYNLGYVPVNKTGDSMSGNLAMSGNKVTGLAAASNNGDAVRFEQVIVLAPAETSATIGTILNGATAKTPPVDADLFPILDSAASFALKKLTWGNLRATLIAAYKDLTGGIVGLTGFNINFTNIAGSFVSFFTNSNTASRTYTFQNRNGTIADDTDLALKPNLSDQDRVAVAISTGTLTLNINSLRSRFFDLTTTVSSAFTIAFSNNSNLVSARLTLRVTGTIAITMPSAVIMDLFEQSSGRWNNSTKILTLEGVTASPFVLEFVSDGTNIWCFGSYRGL